MSQFGAFSELFTFGATCNGRYVASVALNVEG